MAVQLTQETEIKLEQAAADAGTNVNAFVERLLILARNRNSPEDIQRRGEAIDRWLEQMKDMPATSGRDGRPWREFIHEGHKY